MDVEELKIHFKTIATANATIMTFKFDELSSINTDRAKAYPVVLMKTPSSAIVPFTVGTKEPLYENYNITFYYLKPWKKADKAATPLEKAYKECEAIADQYLRDVLNGSNEIHLFGDRKVNKTRGHHKHVDQLVGVQYDFVLRVYNSLC